YVRWTERRNIDAFLRLVASGNVDVRSLISDRVPIGRAPDAYERLLDGGGESPTAILIEYEPTPVETAAPQGLTAPAPAAPLAVGVVGAGSFGSRILIPGLRDAGFELAAVASGAGLTAHAAAEEFSFERALTTDELVGDPALGLIAIATRHSSHAALSIAALRAG